jgi:hypothetical protein
MRTNRTASICVFVATTLGVAVARVPPSRADPALSMYQAMEIVTGTDMRERPRGLALCLEDVLVKVSGDARLRSDPRVARAGTQASDYVVSFNYVDPIIGVRPKDDQGTYDRSQNLTVTFDPAKIDSLLASFGDRPWTGPRPAIVPVLSVHGRKPPDYRLSAEEPLAAEQRAAFDRVATEAGLTVHFPAASDLATWQADEADCDGDTRIVVRGTLDWSETEPGWIGTWHTCWKGNRQAWSIRGVGYDLEFLNVVQGAALLASGNGNPDRLAAQMH